MTAIERESKRFTLITGASLGIGRALAVESARRGRNLALVSLPNEGLSDLSDGLESEFRIVTRYLELDLTSVESCRRIFEWCQAEKLCIDRLFNNAGLGMGGSFLKHTDSYYRYFIDLNVTAPTALIRLFLPLMKELDKAWILNTGSLAGFLPIPYKSIYSAAKSFLLYLALGLKEELKGSSVQMSLLCPNGVPTNDDVLDRIRAGGWLSKMTIQTPENVARLALDQLDKGRAVIIPGLLNKMIYVLGWLVPLPLRARIMARIFKNLP